MASMLTSPKGEHTTFILINGHNIQLTSKYVFLDPWINAAPSPHERLLCEMDGVYYRNSTGQSTKNNIYNVLSHNGISVLHALTLKLSEHHKEG